jgi:hypothetical protein
MKNFWTNICLEKMRTETGQIYVAHDKVKFLSEEECQSYELTHLSKGCWHLNNEELVKLIRLIVHVGASLPHEIRISLPLPELSEVIPEHPVYFEVLVMGETLVKYAGLFGGRNDFDMLDLSEAIINQEIRGGWYLSVRQIFEFLENECRLFIPGDQFVINPDITPTLLTIHNNLIEL